MVLRSRASRVNHSQGIDNMATLSCEGDWVWLQALNQPPNDPTENHQKIIYNQDILALNEKKKMQVRFK